MLDPTVLHRTVRYAALNALCFPLNQISIRTVITGEMGGACRAYGERRGVCGVLVGEN
jgi:hypothetical protein